jgi:hypothetical protein
MEYVCCDAWVSLEPMSSACRKWVGVVDDQARPSLIEFGDLLCFHCQRGQGVALG